MYVYDEYDQQIIEDRVKQFRDQTRRYLAGELHDGLGAELTAARFALANVLTWLPADAPEGCVRAVELAQRALDAAAAP